MGYKSYTRTTIETERVRDVRFREVIIREIKPLEMRELEEVAIGINLSYNPAATEVKLNDISSHVIAYDSIP
ncbi:hypothetical protein H5410_047443 [Solanum commersonii]|uniref:Uncharacterized protein n=1 Tax=Solanum commersonii TaxID=4109 RepID=A0A9J5XF50_SOLCO|nr:hypothetical protein H5410_047443 [Solanum commersonii]